MPGRLARGTSAPRNGAQSVFPGLRTGGTKLEPCWTRTASQAHGSAPIQAGDTAPVSSGGENTTCISEGNKRGETKERERTPVALLGDEP